MNDIDRERGLGRGVGGVVEEGEVWLGFTLSRSQVYAWVIVMHFLL